MAMGGKLNPAAPGPRLMGRGGENIKFDLPLPVAPGAFNPLTGEKNDPPKKVEADARVGDENSLPKLDKLAIVW